MLGWIGVVEFAERDAICFGFRFRFSDGIGLADIDSGGKTHGLHHTPWVAQVAASIKMACLRLTNVDGISESRPTNRTALAYTKVGNLNGPRHHFCLVLA